MYGGMLNIGDLPFEAVSQFTLEEKQVAKAVIEGPILKHDSQRFNRAS